MRWKPIERNGMKLEHVEKMCIKYFKVKSVRNIIFFILKTMEWNKGCIDWYKGIRIGTD